jgi:hypothetical protein
MRSEVLRYVIVEGVEEDLVIFEMKGREKVIIEKASVKDLSNSEASTFWVNLLILQ